MSFHNPFRVLEGLRGNMPEPPAAEASAESVDNSASVRQIPRAVVRMERAGRGGKAVTVVEHLAIAADERLAWLTALKASLACGGTVEGETLVLQGDHRKRLPAILSARGVRKVIVG
jgi:translation initiation factor 1